MKNFLTKRTIIISCITIIFVAFLTTALVAFIHAHMSHSTKDMSTLAPTNVVSDFGASSTIKTLFSDTYKTTGQTDTTTIYYQASGKPYIIELHTNNSTVYTASAAAGNISEKVKQAVSDLLTSQGLIAQNTDQTYDHKPTLYTTYIGRGSICQLGVQTGETKNKINQQYSFACVSESDSKDTYTLAGMLTTTYASTHTLGNFKEIQVKSINDGAQTLAAILYKDLENGDASDAEKTILFIKQGSAWTYLSELQPNFDGGSEPYTMTNELNTALSNKTYGAFVSAHIDDLVF